MLSPAGMSFQNDDLPTNNGAFGSNIHVNTMKLDDTTLDDTWTQDHRP
jgi:hypothetical protein